MTLPAKKIIRCDWAKNNLAILYHDREWGVPCHDDRVLFEFLVLEGAQAGLSWDTILKKRENYRAAFDRFDAKKIARYDQQRVDSLMRSEGIVRNRLKILSVVKNAKAFLEVQKGIRLVRSLYLAVRRRQTACEWLEEFEPTSKPNDGVRRRKQRFAEAWLHFCGLNDLLCLHAGGGHGQRSHGDLLPLPTGLVCRPKNFGLLFESDHSLSEEKVGSVRQG